MKGKIVIEQLFGSKTRVKLLKLFFNNPNRSFYVREITRIVEEQINSVRRELANMLSLGIIKSDSNNNKLYYEVNQKYEHYDALLDMFSDQNKKAKKASKSKSSTKKSKSETESEASEVVEQDNEAGIELPEAKKWSGVGNITGIAYSGVYTRDESAGVDILIVGDVVLSKVESVIVGLEKTKHKELRYAVINADEWKYRSQVRDKFWLQFMGAKNQIVLDKDNIFTKSN